MEEKMLLACKAGNPIDIGGRAFFIHDDIDNLRRIFEDLEREEYGYGNKY